MPKAYPVSSDSAADTTVTVEATRKLPHMPWPKLPSFHAETNVCGLNVVGNENPVTLSVFLWNARNTIEMIGYSARNENATSTTYVVYRSRREVTSALARAG